MVQKIEQLAALWRAHVMTALLHEESATFFARK
jgi:hypothetical protein